MADWLKDIGDKFSQIGAGVRSGADELRKAAGIGVGSVLVQLEAYDFAAGDTIKGTLTVALEDELQADRLMIGLTATSGNIVDDLLENVYEFEKQLDGKRAYRDDVYTFELEIPTELPERAKEWRVVAMLDMGWKRNVQTKTPINVR